MKEEFFSKFIDYNQKLEEILEKKDFSIEVKNLLLSMFYKIENAYQDYEIVKVNVPTKSEYIENLLDMIEDCKNIQLVKKNSEEGVQFQKEKISYKTDKILKTIKVYENEKDLLEAIIDLNSLNIYLPEKYNLIRIAFAEMINEGSKNSDVEIIRDFNAWSWNVLKEEISNIDYNLVYQNLIILLGHESLIEIINNEETEDIIKLLTKELEKLYAKSEVQEFLNLIYKISVDACINRNILEKKRLLDEKTFLESEYNELNNKTQYLDKITQKKKKNNSEIGKIDTILSSKDLLIKEYLKRNEKLPKYNQLFSITHLQEILNKQRRKLLKENDEYNKKLEPQNYIKEKEKIEKQLYLLSNVKQESVNTNFIEENVINLQRKFIVFLEQKLINIKEKEECFEFVHLIRYYKHIPTSKNTIKNISVLSSLIDNIEIKLLNKLWEEKCINKLIQKDKLNITILKNIFDSKIINLLNLQIKVQKYENKLIVELYDSEVLEKTLEIYVEEYEKITIKLNKKIKVFN